MIHARASFFDFVKTEVAANLTGITTPELTADLISPGQPPTFPNCLNVLLFDDKHTKRSNPAMRQLIGTFDLYIEISDPAFPDEAERQAYEAITKINNFMSVQRCPKKDFSSNPVVDLRTLLTWRESYPLDWRSSFVKSSRYVHKTSKLLISYFEEKYTRI